MKLQVTFTPSTAVDASYELNMQQYGQIPPGVNIEYWWKVKDTAGDILQTTPTQYVVYDNNHTWNTLTQGKINVYWYGQNQAFGTAIMTEAQNALKIIASNTGASPNKTVNISVYTSTQDYQASVLGAPEWSGGEEVSQYNAIYVIIEPGNISAELPAVDHELTHVVVNQIIYNPYNGIPFWLNEGLAVHIQFFGVTLPSQFTTPLATAITGNSLITVRSLSDPFSAYPDKANLSYAESVSIVAYLINQYGSSKMNQLLDTFQQGSSYDGALQTIYGFNMDGLFTQWKAWLSSNTGNVPDLLIPEMIFSEWHRAIFNYSISRNTSEQKGKVRFEKNNIFNNSNLVSGTSLLASCGSASDTTSVNNNSSCTTRQSRPATVF